MSSSAALPVELTWAELKPSVFGQRLITQNDSVVKLEVPYRATDDRQVPISVQASLPNGAKVKSVTIIIDENPMPVSLTVRPEQKRSSMWVSASMRFNGPSPVRAIVEAENGQLFMSEAMVKTSGLGACAAPPTTTLDVAAKTMGNMRLTQIVTPLNVSTIAKPVMRTKLDISSSQPDRAATRSDHLAVYSATVCGKACNRSGRRETDDHLKPAFHWRKIQVSPLTMCQTARKKCMLKPRTPTRPCSDILCR